MTGTKPANRRKTPTKSKSETASGESRGQRASAHEAKDTAASKDAAPDAREPKGRRRPRRGPRDGLTPLQARFVQEYLIDLNAAQAARRALWEETVIPLVRHLRDELQAWLAPLYDEDLELDYDLDRVPALTLRREKPGPGCARPTS